MSYLTLQFQVEFPCKNKYRRRTSIYQILCISQLRSRDIDLHVHTCLQDASPIDLSLNQGAPNEVSRLNITM